MYMPAQLNVSVGNDDWSAVLLALMTQKGQYQAEPYYS
jgi:hypothetical protein